MLAEFSLRAWVVTSGPMSLLVAAVYFAAFLAGSALRLTGNVEGVWPPVGVGIAAVYLGGLRLLPGVLLGDILADLPHSLPLATSIGQTTGNMLEVAVAAELLRRLVPNGKPLASLDGLGRFFLAIVSGTAISATIGTMSLLLTDVIAGHEATGVWRTWLLGDTCGALIVVPLALAWLPFHRRPFKGTGAELVLMLLVTVGLTELGLRLEASGPLMYLVFPALIWAALRFGARGGTLAIFVTVTLTVWETAHSKGPFVVHSITNEVLSMQLYIASAAISTLVLVAIAAERERYAARVAASRARIVEAADTERHRLERDLHDGAQQRLSALSIRVEDIRHNGQLSPVDTEAFLRFVSTELSTAIDELRELAHGIHPAILTDFGLERAIESMVSRIAVPVSMSMTLPPDRLDKRAEATAYYVVAESLVNAQRHANCSAIHVRVAVVENELLILVADDGVGGAQAVPGSGLEGLRDRVESAGGGFRVVSIGGGGTHVHASMPLQRRSPVSLGSGGSGSPSDPD